MGVGPACKHCPDEITANDVRPFAGSDAHHSKAPIVANNRNSSSPLICCPKHWNLGFGPVCRKCEQILSA